jgi:hypothetical protein
MAKMNWERRRAVAPERPERGEGPPKSKAGIADPVASPRKVMPRWVKTDGNSSFDRAVVRKRKADAERFCKVKDCDGSCKKWHRL